MADHADRRFYLRVQRGAVCIGFSVGLSIGWNGGRKLGLVRRQRFILRILLRRMRLGFRIEKLLVLFPSRRAQSRVNFARRILAPAALDFQDRILCAKGTCNIRKDNGITFINNLNEWGMLLIPREPKGALTCWACWVASR